MVDDPFDGIPAHLVRQIERIWDTEVRGGGERFQESGDRSGQQGQKAISALLKENGIHPNTDGRWEAVIGHGRKLYKQPRGSGRGSNGAASAGQKPSPTGLRRLRPAPSAQELQGRIYTRGSTFRALAEARQREFRVRTLRARPGRWAHLLDQDGIDRGANFLHPRALRTAQERMAAGKGVSYGRTFGNMLASQAMCFNLFAPLASDDDGLAIAAQALSSFLPDLASVVSIAIEHTPSPEVFNDQHGPAGVDCDVLLVYRTERGERGVLVIETKYVEADFSRCSHRRPDKSIRCPDDVTIGDDFSGCLYASKNRYLYWQRARQYETLAGSALSAKGCPFHGSLWQLWVNHTLAHALADEIGAEQVRFAVCAPVGNEALLRSGATIDAFQRLVRVPETVLFMPLKELIDSIQDAAQRFGDDWTSWSASLAERYIVEARENPAASRNLCPRSESAIG